MKRGSGALQATGQSSRVCGPQSVRPKIARSLGLAYSASAFSIS